MKRVGELDIPDRFAPRVPVVVTQILVAVAATAMAFAVRESSDLVMPTACHCCSTKPRSAFQEAASLAWTWSIL